MIVVCAIDRYFVELAGVMLASFEANAGLPEAEILIVGDGLTAVDRRKLQASARRLLRFVDMTPEMERAVAGLETRARWSRVTYLRLLLPDLLRGRVLYLDADVLVLSDLTPLVEVDMADHVIAACPVTPPARQNSALGRAPDAPYFNAGVLLIDADRWRERGYHAAIQNLLQTRSLPYFDQDALNLVCGGAFHHLDPAWNVQSGAKDFSDAKILHFTHAKPNRADCRHPMRHLFLDYRQRTPWAGKRLRSYALHRLHRIRHSIVKRISAALRSLTWPRQNTHL